MPGPNSFRVRRATVDDLPTLVELWSAMQFDVSGLERRLTEFQVAENLEGRVTGSLGFQVLGRDGFIHHEAFADFAAADAMRTAMWERLQRIAENHGVSRAWTQESAPFWSRNGFVAPTPEVPIPDGINPAAGWLTLQLRETAEQPVQPAIAAEFEVYREVERVRTGQILKRARVLKALALSLGFLLFLGVLAMIVYLARHQRR